MSLKASNPSPRLTNPNICTNTRHCGRTQPQSQLYTSGCAGTIAGEHHCLILFPSRTNLQPTSLCSTNSQSSTAAHTHKSDSLSKPTQKKPLQTSRSSRQYAASDTARALTRVHCHRQTCVFTGVAGFSAAHSKPKQQTRRLQHKNPGGSCAQA